MQGCPRRRAAGACDGPAARRGGQPVFSAPSWRAVARRGRCVSTSVPSGWLPRLLAVRRPRWDPQPSRCRKTQTGNRM